MSFNKCVLSLRLQKKLPIADLREDAKAYEADGMDPEAALLRVVDDRLEVARMEEASILRQIETAYLAAKGPQPAPPEPAPEPTNAQQDETAAQEVEPPARSEEAAPDAQAEQAAEPEPDTGADIPLAFWKKVKVPHEVLVEETGAIETIEVPASEAAKSVREDIANLQALLKCMKGGA